MGNGPSAAPINQQMKALLMPKPEFSYSIESIKPFYKDGRTDYLFAHVGLNVVREGHHEHGDNIHVHVQLPPGSEKLDFESLEDLAVDEAVRLLGVAAEFKRNA
ncbi:hypothetical protein [Sinorhizobium meliloti]|uniref:hypothetical protein n=1 Tax=Rhizobium meliloti TaxID=382 RepID=UPI0012965764|nr:hypothetical protein [Sinorhizobium meliloti]MDE3854809.1 hypothetical protein [Sinorhizobium meliloti]MQW52486.1 hypothetical protein [Sinorhizobium meliloti]